jgi:prepilin-type N-terminal cleavage/methylation domain-containing protein
MSRRRAFTLPELLVSIALGGFIAIITAVSLKGAVAVFGNTSGRDTAMRDLMRVRRALESDLPQASLAPNRFAIQPVPGSLGGGFDGDAINYTTAVNATTGEVVQLDDGTGGLWHHRNLYFYVVVPANHDTLFGATCTGGNEGNYDYNCPHKVMLRGLADQNPATTPHNASTEDALLNLGPMLTRPTGFPSTATLQTVAINLLTFQVRRINQELLIDLRAVSLPDARSRVGIGNHSFRTGGYTIEHRFSIFPKN